jgi:two-component system CheB/CheR fusion protein
VVASGESAHPDSGLTAVFERLREAYGIDFNLYKPATISRRIERRLSLVQLSNVEDYCHRVLTDPAELDALYRDLLIGVTRFFRDPEAFDVLRQKIVPGVVDSVAPEEDVRIWVPACATGEEAYSLGILFLQELDQRKRPPNLKIFATDVHRDSLRIAAEGLYPEESLEPMPTRLREEFFAREPDGRFRVLARLRKAMLFSPHNLIKDVPFNRIDFVSCRNLLIYFQPTAQTRAITAFHFALKLKGILFLGPSESTGDLERDFETVDRQWKIYAKTSDNRLPLDLRVRAPIGAPLPPRPAANSDPRLARVYDQLLNQFMPPGVLVNDKREAIHLFGNANRFVRPQAGRLTHDLVGMCEGDLRIALSSAIQNALKRGERVVLRSVRVPHGDDQTIVDVAAEPLIDKTTGSAFVLVNFLEERPAPQPTRLPETTVDLDAEAKNRVQHLEAELQDTRESLQTMVEELETTNEELQASNEELLASNEELQSTNEELHSVNEELYSVNAEHEQKIRELAATTADLRNLMDVTHAGIVFTDTQQRVRLFTPGAAELLNLLPQDTGRPLAHITSRTKGDDLLEDLALVEKTRKPTEKEVRTLEGRRFLRRITPYHDADRQHAGLVVAFLDITALVEAQETVRASEHRFRLITETLPQLVWTAHRDGPCDYLSQRWADYTGVPVAHHLGLGWLEQIHPEDHAAVLESWTASMRTGEPLEMEFRIRRHDGVFRWFNTRAVLLQDASPQTTKWLISSTDVEEQRRSADELREREHRFRQMANEAPVMIWLADADGQRVFLNQTWLDTTGRTHPREAVDAWLADLHPDDREAFARAYWEGIHEHRSFESECRLRCANGEYAWIFARAKPRLGAENTFLGLIGCCTDVTQQKELAREQKRIENKLEETAKLESLGILAGGIAHDFNNILTGILGNVSLAQMDVPPDSPLRQSLQAVHRAALRASDLCKQMLAYSGRGRFVLKRVELGWLVKDTTNLIHASISKNVRLDLELAANLPPVEMDVPQIQQVIMNLVINASEAIGDQPGVIRITTGACTGPADLAGLEIISPDRSANAYIYLRVADNGCGIGADSLRRIFDPFYTTKFTGRGLGLAAVLGIVRGHKGALYVSSELGQGTSFRLLLPWTDSPPPASEAPPGAGSDSTPGHGSILVVDDEEAVRTTVGRILERHGYRCALAADGIDGLRQYSQSPHQFRLVILDLTMPGLSGTQTFAELRRLNPEAKVLLISGFSENDAISRFSDTAPDGFLQKPIGLEDLLAAVADVLK